MAGIDRMTLFRALADALEHDGLTSGELLAIILLADGEPADNSRTPGAFTGMLPRTNVWTSVHI